MLDIIGKRNWYFALSLLLIIPGVISMILWGFQLSIDFTGGSRMTLSYPEVVNDQKVEQIKNIFEKNNAEVVTIQKSDKMVIVRTKTIDDKKDIKILSDLQKETGRVKQEQFETIGPVIGKETTINAFSSVALSSFLIVLYIAWSFRGVRKPVSSWRFGICAVIALLHDALILVGAFSLLGHFWGVEIDSLFITALLTVIGFSVHDTIVVFDRVRENLRKNIEAPFEQVANDAILQTLVRSLNTSFTALLVLFTVLLFGGESIRWFVVAMIIGIAVGTYSSIFNAAPLLVVWQNWASRRKK